MFCSKCGEKLNDSNQNFCHNCGAEVLDYPKATSPKKERPQVEMQPQPQVFYVPIKRPELIQKGPPGKYSKLCLVMALTSLAIGLISLMIGYASQMFYYDPYYYEYYTIRRLALMIINLFFRVGGLILGIFSKVNGSKAELHEPPNDMERAGSIIGILAIIANAIGLLLIFFGPYSLIYYNNMID